MQNLNYYAAYLSFLSDAQLICFFIQDLAKELLEMFTVRKMGKAFFTNSGSEANDTQVCFINSCKALFVFLWKTCIIKLTYQ